MRQLAVSDEGLIYQNLDVTLKLDHTQLQSGALYLSESLVFLQFLIIIFAFN